MADIGEILALSKKQSIKFSSSGFVSMVYKSRDDVNSTVTYTHTYKDSTGTNQAYDVVYRDGKNAPKFTKVEFVDQNLVFTLDDNSTQVLANAKQLLKGDQGIQGLSPQVEINGTNVRFSKQDNSFTDWVDLQGKTGETPKQTWIDGTKLAFIDPKTNTMSTPVDLIGKTGDKGQSLSDRIIEAYSTSDGDVMFKIRNSMDNSIYEILWDNALPSIASFNNYIEYMGSFDINNLPKEIKKGWAFRVQTPFTYNGKQYPSGSVVIANKDKTTSSSIEAVDFDYYTNRASSINLKVEEETIQITQDTYQLTLSNFDNSKDGLLISVSGSNKAGAVILNEGVDFTIGIDSKINIVSTKLINGDIVVVKKFIGVKESYVKIWKSGENYFKDELIKSLANGFIYLCINDVVNSTQDPSVDVTNFKGISFTTSIPVFTKGSNYSETNVVIDPSDGSIYRCVKPILNAQVFPKDDTTNINWSSLIKQGEGIYQLYLRTTTDTPPMNETEFRKSLNGKGITFKGAYDNITRYHLNDMVTYDGIAFVCTNDTVVGIIGEVPNKDSTTGSWTVAMVSNINSGSIIRDDLNNAPNFCYSILKTNQELNLRARKDEVLIKGSETPYIPTTTGSPVSKGYLEDYSKNISLDDIKDGTQFKKSEVAYSLSEKNKLASIQTNNLGFADNLAQIQAKYPSPEDGSFFINGSSNGTFWVYKNGQWSDTLAKNGTGLTK